MAEEQGQPAQQSRTRLIERELSGELPCVGCRYNLKGLSVMGLCPECGVAVRATLLAVVDPHASELQPIRHPRVVYAALLVWAIASLVAVSAVWALRMTEFVATSASAHLPSTIWTLARVAVWGWMCAGLAVLLVARPHEYLPSWTSRSVVIAAAGYLLLAYIQARILLGIDAGGQHSLFVAAVAPGLQRTLFRCGEDACVVAIVAGMSRLWAALQARSVLMRSGRLDRQSAPSMYAAIGIVAAGDLIWLVWSPPAGVGIDGSSLRLVCQSLVAVGSVLLTVGLIAILMDVVRLRKVILAMPLSMEQLTEAGQGGGL